MTGRSVMIAILLTLICCALQTSAKELAFYFEPTKLDVGNVYVYQLSSNPEKFEPSALVHYYFASLTEDHIEIERAVTDSSHSERSRTYERYQINLHQMMLESLQYEYLVGEGILPINTTCRGEITADFENQRIYFGYLNHTEDGFRRYNKETNYKAVPTFSYHFLHIDLCTALRFYPFPKRKLSVGEINNDQFYLDSQLKYRGKELVEVPAGQVTCHKFELAGKGLLAWLFGKRAWIWTTAEDPRSYMVKYRNENPQSAYNPIMELHLADIKSMSLSDWRDTFISPITKPEARESLGR